MEVIRDTDLARQWDDLIIAFIRNSCAVPGLDPARIRVLLAKPFLLQLA